MVFKVLTIAVVTINRWLFQLNVRGDKKSDYFAMIITQVDTIHGLQKCPHGMTDQGLFCRKAEYWRPAYPWKWWDRWVTLKCGKDVVKITDIMDAKSREQLFIPNVSQDSILQVTVSVGQTDLTSMLQGWVFSLIYPVRRNNGKENLI